MNKTWTPQEIKENLLKSDVWLTKAVLAIYKYQTRYEQDAQTTHDKNNVGFNGVDAQIMSSFAQWIQKGRRLSPKQTAIARKKIVKYSKQLALIANEKQG